MIKLIGILVIVVGFAFKLDTLAVVLFAGILTGLSAGLDFVAILETLGRAFVNTRYMSLFLLTLAVVGILERNGLRESATKLILKLKGATGGKILSIYVFVRCILSALSLRISGHVQFIRPLIYPMVKAAAQKQHHLNSQQDEKIKGMCNAMENYGNFFGQNIFLASPGVLLIVGSLSEAGIRVSAYDLGLASIPIGVISVIYAVIGNYILDQKLRGVK